MSAALPSHAPLSPAEDALRIARRGTLGLALGLGGFLAWACLAPLGQGVAAHGTVVVDGERKAVQSLHGGTVEKILVREGDVVARGQLLVQLETVEAEAQREIVLGQWLAARASEARLAAERLGRAKLTWPDDLAARKEEPAAREAMQLQQDLFATRRSELANRRKILAHEREALREQLVGLREVAKSYADQLVIASSEREDLRGLVEQGYLPRNRLFAAERGVSQLTAQRAASLAEIRRTEEALQENELKALQEAEGYRRDAETQLAAIATQAASLGEQLAALEIEVERGGVVAPVDGRVMALAIHTEGGVVAPAQLLMEIVPQRASWVVKAEFPPLLAERLAPGLPVDVRFATLDRAHTPVVAGRVVTVSADQQRDARTGEAHFAVSIAPAPEAEAQLHEAGLAVRPGMQAEVLVKTGERTLASYLAKPLRERLAGALTEE